MTRPIRLNIFVAWLVAVLLFCVSAAAQQKAQSTAEQRRSFDVRIEVSLQGTVVSLAENSSAAPLGAHVVIQTATGQVDVHLGDARLMQTNGFTLAAGDSIRVIGEDVPYGEGSQFFARILQKGSQTLALRSTRGFPLRPVPKAGKAEAGGLGSPRRSFLPRARPFSPPGAAGKRPPPFPPPPPGNSPNPTPKAPTLSPRPHPA